jgi:hypothetical protein
MNLRHSFEPLDDRVRQSLHLCRFAVTCATKIDVADDDVRRVVSGIERKGLHDGLDQESGAGEQQQRQRELRDDERRANPPPSRTAGSRSPVLQRRLRIS